MGFLEQLPVEIILDVVNRLEDVSDRIRFSLACKSLRDVVLQHHTNPQIPWLLLPRDTIDDKTIITFFDMLSSRVFTCKLPKSLQGGRCRGSSKGWLFFTKRLGAIKPRIYLLNPLSGFYIKLPSITTIPLYRRKLLRHRTLIDCCDFSLFVMKIELSSSNLADCTIAMICGVDERIIVTCQPRSKRWNIIKERDMYMDILFSNKISPLPVLYALRSCDRDGFEDTTRTLSIDGKHEILLTTIPEITQDSYDGEVNYYDTNDFFFNKDTIYVKSLVESSSGELMILALVQSQFEGKHEHNPRFFYFQTSNFKLHMMKPSVNSANEPNGWRATPLDGLDDDEMIFKEEGGCTFHRISTGMQGLTGNCIYFGGTDSCYSSDGHIPYVSRESGVFYFKDQTIKRLFPSISYPATFSTSWFAPHISMSASSVTKL